MRLPLIWALLLLAAPVLAADPKTAYSDPEKAAEDPDFKTQGEYLGAVAHDGTETPLGVQVIALGDGKFQATSFRGGLPGAGADLSTRLVSQGERKDNEIRFENNGYKAFLEGDTITMFNADDKEIGTAKKVERKSPTLGLEAPEGAIVLFAKPEDAANFQGGKVDENGFLEQGVTSKQKFDGDFTIHIEFRLPYMPHARGQGRGNSGYYAQGKYEVQMLDSFGLEGKNNECGGIYEFHDPSPNMCLPPLTWQTYDIDFTAPKYDADGNKTSEARMTVRHNGVVVQDDKEIPRPTRAAPVKEGPGGGPVYIQNHGNPVRYRNIWIQPKSAA